MRGTGRCFGVLQMRVGDGAEAEEGPTRVRMLYTFWRGNGGDAGRR